ncbi:MAG TPA: polysaccharide biosynthesis/export family protein [Gemmatimonadaceae bacterium]
MHFHRFCTPRAAHALIALLCIATSIPVRAQDIDGAAQRAATLRVRPGDRIDLHFLREPQLTGSFSVNEKGEASFPKLGAINVAHMTSAQLQDTLRTRYSEFLRAPEFEVAVLRRVVVNGEVKVPNVYLVDVSSTVRDVIAKAGGLTESGSASRVWIVRSGKRQSVKGWERGEGPTMDLVSGDQVLVGRKSWLELNFLPAVSTAVVVTTLVLQIRRRG